MSFPQFSFSLLLAYAYKYIDFIFPFISVILTYFFFLHIHVFCSDNSLCSLIISCEPLLLTVCLKNFAVFCLNVLLAVAGFHVLRSRIHFYVSVDNCYIISRMSGT